MPRTPTTPAQVSSHQFLIRRVEHALVRADARMLHDPLRSRSRAMAAGVVLIVLMMAGTAIIELVRPRGAASAQAEIMVVAEAGTLHVRINDTVHPVANLASARLILGHTAVPQRVRQDVLNGVDFGHPVGIAAAPPIAHDTPPTAPTAWGVCDHTTTPLHQPLTIDTTVARSGDTPHQEEASALVHDGEHSWLLHAGTKARIDTSDPVLFRALGLATTKVRPASPHLLAVVPEIAAVTKPEIDRAGHPSGFAAPFDVIGKVVQVGRTFVVVGADGAVEVPPSIARVAAAYSGMEHGTEPALAQIPIGQAMDFGSLPETMPKWAPEEGWLCADASHTETKVTVGPDNLSSKMHELPWKSAEDTAIDGYVGGHRGTIAVDVGSSVHLITEAGVRSIVENREAVAALGYSEPAPVNVPWRAIAALPAGPELSTSAALQPAAQPKEEQPQPAAARMQEAVAPREELADAPFNQSEPVGAGTETP